MTKRNPIIADFRPHMDSLIITHAGMTQWEAGHWAKLITWAFESSTPIKTARYYGFRVSTLVQLEQAYRILSRISRLPVTN